METLSNERQPLSDFKELGNIEECHIVWLDVAFCAWRHTQKHSWPFTPSLYAKEQMLCNFLFSIETIASTPCLTRPFSPSLPQNWLEILHSNVNFPYCLQQNVAPSILKGGSVHNLLECIYIQSASLRNRWPLYSMFCVWVCALTSLFMCMAHSLWASQRSLLF